MTAPLILQNCKVAVMIRPCTIGLTCIGCSVADCIGAAYCLAASALQSTLQMQVLFVETGFGADQHGQNVTVSCISVLAHSCVQACNYATCLHAACVDLVALTMQARA